MNSCILLIGDGPFATNMARKFKQHGYSIIMTTIEEKNIEKIKSNGYIPIYTNNLHEENCKKIYETCVKILNDYGLKLTHIVHTARNSFYEYDLKVEHNSDTGCDIFHEVSDLEPPDENKSEMFNVNSKSPELLAKYFSELDCQFIYTSSCATKGFNKNLAVHASEKENNKKVGTHAIKYYSYTKRLGEENLYSFFKKIDRLSSLTIIYITLMLGTNFYTDIGIPDPTHMKGYLSVEQTANHVADMILKNKKRIYVGWQAKALRLFPRKMNAAVLNAQQWLSK